MEEQRCILFVDDDEKILKSLQRGFLDEPYKTYCATSGKEALKILERREIHVLVTDMRMPEMSGIELLRIVKEEYPRIVRLVLSGYTQVGTLLTAINQGEIFKFITKPWKLEDEFKSIIKEALARYDAQVESEKTAEAPVTSDAS